MKTEVWYDEIRWYELRQGLETWTNDTAAKSPENHRPLLLPSTSSPERRTPSDQILSLITRRTKQISPEFELLMQTVPRPVNGMVRTYDNKNRTFQRPYSAKTVFFYKDNDVYFTGLRVPVTKARYRTIDSLLDDLNGNIQLPFGVRHLYTPHGRTRVTDVTQLEHMGK
ncbi:unnamed protein product [Bursaphelenchus okinawaensis]|uniref:Doublecortin domain-containing protein n=1 Tax=Bursaphelenchus okinawaensis TaxID=465554 RepID=A0A811JQT5_9BILA|nr:unnamed protein product [Bursaphelenchus okinawaensis]CAG9079080.1 unnamed protein product [Bursaphelenchus okinawaensis]